MDNKQKKIAFLVPNLGGAGAERMMANLATGFAHENFSVDLVLYKAKGTFLEKIPNEINIVELDVDRALFSVFKIIRYLKTHKPDVLISTLSRVNISSVLAKKISGVNTRVILREANTFSVYTDSNNNFWEKMIYYVARLVYPMADNIVGVSKGVADDIKKHFKNIDSGKISVVYNPVVDEEIFLKAAENVEHPWFKEDIPIILGIGRITPQKDFSTLIRAFHIVQKSQNIRLIILGSGKKEEGGTPEEYEKIKTLLEELNLQKIVDMPGFTKNPFAFMSRASLFILSSKWEGLPGVLIQAMACGCPVVATDCPSGPNEVLNGGEFGKLVPVGNYQLLAEQIKSTLIDPIDKEILTARAKEFSIPNAVKNYSALFN